MLQNKKIRAALAAIVLLAVAGAVFYGLRHRFTGPINALDVDLSAPYAYVSTPSLSKLPRDLVRAPVVRDLLTEDFAFYYEEHEDRMGLRGAIKRIAFEHDTTLPDQLLEAALDAPAEMAWWPDAKGAPRHWLLAMTRGPLATVLQGLASVAAKDTQLSVVASVRANGEEVTAYALTLSARRTLLLLSQGNRVVVLSDPGLLFDAQRQPDARALKVVAGLLSDDAAGQSAYRRHFGLGAESDGHRIVADARLLSFGYQHFFPGLQALRIDLAAGGASLATALRLQADAAAPVLPAAAVERTLWSGLPLGPAACAMVPVQWSRLAAVMQGRKTEAEDAPKVDWPAFAAQFEGPVAVCWYARSQLHTPLLVAQTKADAGAAQASTAALEALSRWALASAAERNAAGVPAGAQAWHSEIDAPWGGHVDADADGESSYHPTLARQDRWITFSPDDTLVDLALKTQGKQYPSVLDALPAASGSTLAVASPAQMAELLQREAFAVLPESQEVLRQAAEKHLLPRLAALRKLPAVRAVAATAPDAAGWVTVDWQPLRAVAGKTP